MKSTVQIKRQLRWLYRYFNVVFSDNTVSGGQWLEDNKMRLLEACADTERAIPVIKLPAGDGALPRIFELARATVVSVNGSIDGDAVLTLREHQLTSAEFDLLPIALKWALLTYLEELLRDKGNQQYVASAIRSLILFDDMDFSVLRKLCLRQEEVLLTDITYRESTEEARARYRERVAFMAKASGMDEVSLLEKCSRFNNGDITENLFLSGKDLFCEDLGIRCRGGLYKIRLFAYVLAITALTVLGVVGITLFNNAALTVFAIFSIIPFFVFFTSVINRCLLSSLRPQSSFMLREEYADTPKNKTATVLTVMVAGKEEAQNSLKRIEEHFAANRIDNGVYVILADLPEGEGEISTDDGAITDTLEAGIKELNKSYGERFVLLVRKRTFNGRVYSGWERKRGAIEELVKFILSGDDVFFVKVNGDKMKDVRYVCTLDADTVMPPQSLVKLMGIIAHPINSCSGKAGGGYGLVQPEIKDLPDNYTTFACICAPTGGIDAYSTSLAEVNWDFLHSGTFCGKGIFSVSAYAERVLGRIEPATVLSHDLIEGEMLGALRAGDVSFLDKFPQTPISYYKRRERWLRGDWMLVPYLFSGLSAVSKWKIFFNLLQAVYPLWIFLQAVAAPFAGIYAYALWAICLIELSLPTVFAYWGAFSVNADRNVIRDNSENRLNAIKRSCLNKLFLPYEAISALCASAKGFWRRLTRSRRSLEWATFDPFSSQKGVKGYYGFFALSLVCAIGFYGVCVYNGIGIVLGLVASLMWVLAPYFAFVMGRRKKKEEIRLLPDENHSLRLLAMRTVRFFYEALEDNGYVMPDNLQLKPYKGYADRTSPTNMGFALLAVLSGVKFGAISVGKASRMLTAQVERITKMEKYKGNLYNWYRVSDGGVLSKYVSTVDSGNFCACLITLKEGIEALKERQIASKSQCNGMGDAVFSVLDGAEEDFRVHLEEFGEDMYMLTGRKAITRARDFMREGIIASCESASFIREMLKYWIEDFDALSFSDGLIRRIDDTGEFNLRPLKEYLLSFPKPINEVLKIHDLDRKLDSLVWCAGRERYGHLIKEVRKEFKRIYGYAFRISDELDKVKRFAEEFLDNVELEALYNKKRGLFAIGVDGETGKRSKSCYDLLMSESRLTSFVAISLGKIPAENWFKLSRQYTRYASRPMCLSWSGTAFEYLMPDIFIKPQENSMLGVSTLLSVHAQIESANKNGLWGISESAYASLDASGEYRYKAFGISKTALASFNEEKVYAPYATLLSIEYAPRECMDNVIRLVENGCAGLYGMYEAIDLTHRRGGEKAVVYSFMAHHSGMSLCALTNFFFGGALRKAFCADRAISACTVLLKEKMPAGVPERRYGKAAEAVYEAQPQYLREFLRPQTQNEGYTVLCSGETRIEASSRGRLKVYYKNAFIGDAYIYLVTEKKSGIAYLPVMDKTQEYSAEFYPEKVKYSAWTKNFKAECEVYALVGEDECLFDIKLINLSSDIAVAEAVLVLDPALNDEEAYRAHKCFNGLFIEAEVCDGGMRVKNRKSECCVEALAVGGEDTVLATDKKQVIGRGRSFKCPELDISGFKKYPIEPIIAVKSRAVMDESGEKSISFVLRFNGGKRLTRSDINVKKEDTRIFTCGDMGAFSVTVEEWLISQRLAFFLKEKYKAEYVCASPEVLWQQSLSDKIPLMTVYLPENYSAPKLKTLLRAADHLITRGLSMQVLIVEDTADDYLDEAFGLTEKLIMELGARESFRHIRRNEFLWKNMGQIKALSFLYVSLENGLDDIAVPERGVAVKRITESENKYPVAVNEEMEGEFDCGYGRFINDGREYYIYRRTPMPWCNVITNGQFGTLITESGGAYTWQGNSCMNKLTPWYNDTVCDRSGEAVYLRDNKTNAYWSITRDPIDRGDMHATVYSKGVGIYRYNGFGIEQRQTVFVHPKENIKIISVEAESVGDRDISLFLAIKPVLGQSHEDAYKYQETELIDGVLCVKRNNAYMFIYAKNAQYCDNYGDFFGNYDMEGPQAVREGEFVEGADKTPLLALKTRLLERCDLFIGYARDKDEVLRLKKLIDDSDASRWLEEVKEYWRDLTGGIRIKTPDRKLDIIFNNWLLYQTVSSRLQGRCGYYQAGGAYGFRDQLQDCLSQMIQRPNYVREHILRCAAHQFREGDVQHWWHEPFSGVRTRVSDDLLFLPYITAKYISTTGDKGILDELVPFVEGHELGERDDLYESAWRSNESAALFEHCMRAIRLVIRRRGKNKLPLILSGDWNDGMNGLGKGGRGESVWLGWFLYAVISDFLPYVEERDKAEAQGLRQVASELCASLNSVCWDGKWFIRAFDDNGRIIGGNMSRCAEIDAISQAWSVLSGAGRCELSAQAMQSVSEKLIDRKNGIVKLLDPPFTKDFGAGYIGDYISGIRENGGQYTHGAVWVAEAFLLSGEVEKGYSVLDMLNPINHTLDRYKTDEYKLEPYVMPADVYANEENVGRGGWSWYTASGALYFDAVLTYLLGITKEGDKINVSPHIPSSWRELSVSIDTDDRPIDIKILNSSGKGHSPESINVVKKGDKKEIRVVL